MESSTPRTKNPVSGARRLIVGRIRSRSKGLLNMMYTATELADVLGITRRALVTQWIAAGVPHTKDDRGLYWFSGLEVASWIGAQALARNRARLKSDQALCLTCREVVTMLNSETRTVSVMRDKTAIGKSSLIKVTGTCPNCGREIQRFGGDTSGVTW